MTEKNENDQAAVLLSNVTTHDFEEDDSKALPPGAMVVGEIAHHHETPNFTAVSVLLSAEHDVLPGQFLLAWHGKREVGIFTVVQVNDCAEVNPNELPELSVARSRLGLGKNYADEGVSTRIYRLALCETIEELTVKTDDWSVKATRAPQTLPRAGDPVIVMPPEIVCSTIGGLPNEGDGLAVGTTFDAEPINVVLKPQVLQLGAFIAGNPGKGKSYYGGVLVEEARAWGVRTMVLDV